ncbi:hypothetical protein NQ314_000317 [Rhamnusium bicolor]|uniref:Deltamethrin resistance protein prag01 domain-containing protein n=1 Tax=Rhamnusium bicolor TaxID=1586634 RepID=A0AAV8ZYM6_9CUCU|nr:hypothetical protein NQ314_000317 [Rhamnusium bicolor]
MQAPRALCRHTIKQFGKRYAHQPAQSTYNDLPQPQGSWQTHHDAAQRRYNAHLVIGIGALIGTIAFGKVAGLLETYSDNPEHPAVIESYK